MAYTPIYTRKNFVNNSAPAINATNLNDIEDALVSLGNGLQTAAADTDTNTADIATINGEISDINDLIAEMLPVDSASGNPAVINDAFGGAAKSLILTLEPVQSGSGTPSPQNVRPITGRTQSAVKRTGANMLDTSTVTKSGITFSQDSNGYITASPVGSDSRIWAYSSAQYYLDLPAGSYNLIVDTSTPVTGSYAPYAQIRLYNSDGASILSNTASLLSSGVTVIPFVLSIKRSVGAMIKQFNGIMRFAIVPQDFTQWAPYNAESINRVYGETVYGVTDECTGAGATKTKGLYIPSVSSVGYSTSAGCNYADCHGITVIEDSDTICNMYDQIPYGDTGAEGKYKVYPSAITIYDSRFTDVATAQAILDSCQIVYPLYTPVLIPLTPQNLTLLKGDNVIATDADNVDVEYSADIKLYINKMLGTSSSDTRSAKSSGTSEEETKTIEEKTIEPEEAKK